MTTKIPASARRVPEKTYSILNELKKNQTASRIRTNKITKDDINDLKIERQKLLDERQQLKTKIVRLEAQSKRSAKNGSANQNLLTQLDREYKNVEHLIAQQRAQINELLRSDSAAERQELQEEAKIIYQERLRLHELQVQQQIDLNQAKQELDDLLASDGPVVYERQARKISELEEKLRKYEKANKKLSDKIQKLKQEKKLQEESQNGAIGSRAAQLKSQIKEVEQKTEEIEQKIRESKEKHEIVMKQIRQSLLEQNHPKSQ